MVKGQKWGGVDSRGQGCWGCGLENPKPLEAGGEHAELDISPACQLPHQPGAATPVPSTLPPSKPAPCPPHPGLGTGLAQLPPWAPRATSQVTLPVTLAAHQKLTLCPKLPKATPPSGRAMAEAQPAFGWHVPEFSSGFFYLFCSVF